MWVQLTSDRNKEAFLLNTDTVERIERVWDDEKENGCVLYRLGGQVMIRVFDSYDSVTRLLWERR